MTTALSTDETCKRLSVVINVHITSMMRSVNFIHQASGAERPGIGPFNVTQREVIQYFQGPEKSGRVKTNSVYTQFG